MTKVVDTAPCNTCGKPGALVWSDTFPPIRHLGINEPFEVKYFLCRWHKAAETKRHRRIFGESRP